MRLWQEEVLVRRLRKWKAIRFDRKAVKWLKSVFLVVALGVHSLLVVVCLQETLGYSFLRQMGLVVVLTVGLGLYVWVAFWMDRKGR